MKTQQQETVNQNKNINFIEAVTNPIKSKNFDQNCAIYDTCGRNMSKQNKEELWIEAQKTSLNIYVRTLFEVSRTLPNIIKILDQIIENRASNASFGTAGFASNTYAEIDKVIALGERKDKLLNLHVITETMLKMLSERERKFIMMKFIKKRNIDAIALELGINKRNVYRLSNNVIKKLCIKLLERNWTAQFIDFQIGSNERWIREIFTKIQQDDYANSRKGRCAEKEA